MLKREVGREDVMKYFGEEIRRIKNLPKEKFSPNPACLGTAG